MPSLNLGGLTGITGARRAMLLSTAAVLGATLIPVAPATANLEAWRWSTNTVCVEDNTSSSYWPVKAAVWRIDRASDMYAVTASDCSGTRQKVWVSRYRKADGHCGLTTIWRDANYRLLYARVQLNTYYWSCLSSGTRRAHVVSHEIGHAFGLAHTSRNDSVMSTSTWSYDNVPYMTNYDYAELERRYPW